MVAYIVDEEGLGAIISHAMALTELCSFLVIFGSPGCSKFNVTVRFPQILFC